MTSIKKNLTATFLGKIWTTLMSIIFLPYYIKLLGIEAYGLVGVYTAMLALFSVLDFGLGNTMNREMARMSSQGNQAGDFRDLTRTLEWIYWAIAILISGVIFLMAPFFSDRWINADALSRDTIRQAIYFIGAALAFLWPSSLYSGGLMGLQQQVLLNGINVVCATLRGLGMVLILTFISPTIQAFFIWQILVNGLQTMLSAFFLWKNLPKSPKTARFDIAILKRVKRFAMGIATSTLLATILAQMDKIVLSKTLSLEMFGYYTLATMIASALFYITVPVFSVFFPHFTQLVCSNDSEGLKRMYHIACQLMSVLILPIALLVIVFSSELLFTWTRNATTVENTHQLVKLLMIGTLLNALMTTPFALQLAHGWTRLSFYLNLFGVIFLFPVLFWTSSHFGSRGAAGIWILLNASFFLINLECMHRKILRLEKWRWCFQDVGMPLLAALAIILAGRWFFSMENTGTFFIVAYLIVIYLLSLSAAFLVSPRARNWVMEGLFKHRALIFKNDTQV